MNEQNKISVLKWKKQQLHNNYATVDPKTNIVTIDNTEYATWQIAYNLECNKTENWIQNSIDNNLLLQMKKEAHK